MRRRTLLATFLFTFTGCADLDDGAAGRDAEMPTGAHPVTEVERADDVLDPSDREKVAYERQLPPGATVAPDDGTIDQELTERATREHVSVLVNTGASIERMDAEVDARGRLVVEGDIIVGEIDPNSAPGDAERVARLAIVSDSGTRWPDGVVPYAFSGFDANVAAEATTMRRIEAAMDLIAQRTPVRFVERSGQANWVRFVKSTEKGWSYSKIGMKGGVQDVEIWWEHGPGVIAHELLHTLGSWHEQSRPDRDDNLEYHPECVATGKKGNFTVHTSALVPERYDFESLMHYDSSSGCLRDDDDKCTCMPLTVRPTSVFCPSSICKDKDGDGFAEFVDAQRSRLSNLDIGSTFQMYGGALGKDEANDAFGATSAVGDFDADGYEDLAIAAPAESPGSDPASGVVFLFKGSNLGLVPWRTLSQETRPLDATGKLGDALGWNEAGDRFGAALAAGDLNDDGVDDLVVGSPGEGPSGAPMGAGVIYTFLGFRNTAGDARHGLQPWAGLTQEALNVGQSEANDFFGSALAIGDFDDDGRADDVAVGVPGEAPGAAAASGTVVILRGSSTGLVGWKVVLESALVAAAAGDAFGSALAAGDFDGDGDDDLAVGAPRRDQGTLVNAGAVFLYQSSSTGPIGWANLQAGILGTRGAYDHFGAALAAGDLDGGTDDLAIGAPDADGGGRVHIFRGRSNNTPSGLELLSQAGLGANEEGDRFGATLAIAQVDTDYYRELLVAAPREQPGADVRLGVVFVFRGGDGGPEAWKLLGHGSLLAHHAGDDFGTSLAVGDFDSENGYDVVAGVSKHDGAAGAAVHFDFLDHDPDELYADQVLSQELAAPYVD